MKKGLLSFALLLSLVVLGGCAGAWAVGGIAVAVGYQVAHDEIAFPIVKREAENEVYKRLKLATPTPELSRPRAIVVPSQKPGRYNPEGKKD